MVFVNVLCLLNASRTKIVDGLLEASSSGPGVLASLFTKGHGIQRIDSLGPDDKDPQGFSSLRL